MTAKSSALANKVITWALGDPASQPGQPLQVALSTTVMGPGGTNFTEQNGTGYARVSDPSFGSASGGQRSNDAAITFPQAQAGDWPDSTDVAIFESDGTTLVYFGPLTGQPIAVGVGETLSFAIGALDIGEQ